MTLYYYLFSTNDNKKSIQLPLLERGITNNGKELYHATELEKLYWWDLIKLAMLLDYRGSRLRL